MSMSTNLLLSLVLVCHSSQAAFLRAPFLSQPSSGDIVHQTRTQANTLKTTLRSLARNSESAPILRKVFAGSNNDCINSMEDAIEAIETSTKLFENAGTEMKLLVQTVQEFQNTRDTGKAVKTTAKIIRLLDVLIPKLTPPTSVCKTTSEDVFASMRSLGALVTELAENDDIYTNAHGRQSLKSSAQILSTVTNFLTKESHFKFDHFCTKDKEHNKEFITAIGNMMTDLAGLYEALGQGDIAANELRRQERFTRKVVDNLDKLGGLNIVSLDCNTPGSSKLVADTLDDLAGLIDDIGMSNLCNQLGLDAADCSF